MTVEQVDVTPKVDGNSPPPVDGRIEQPRRWSRRARVAAFAGTLLLGASCTFLFDAATAPLSKPGFCASCHEMEAQHASWQESPHHTNASGVQVTCVECHLPHKDDRVAHTTAKCWTGVHHAAVHVFGQYDEEAARQTVRETLPNDRCVRCHSHLTGSPNSRAVGIVHATALKSAGDRTHACITCHDALHGPRPAAPPKKSYERGDNSYCQVCHINFQQEEFAVTHVKAGISCRDCHGDSEPHAEDEEHLTPANILFSKARVNDSCMTSECHPKPKMEAEIGHRPFFAGADPEHAYCTDCHGEHRVPKRTRRWDKDTRKLIEVDGRAITPDNPPPRRSTKSEDMM